jgi:hypothetical protein
MLGSQVLESDSVREGPLLSEFAGKEDRTGKRGGQSGSLSSTLWIPFLESTVEMTP